MKIKRLSVLTSAVALGFSAILSIAFMGVAHAAAPYTCTWTGTDSSNFSDALNWTGCNSAAPQPSDDDTLIFDNTSLSANTTVNNDITGLALTNITFQGSSDYSYTIEGDGVTLSGGITNTSDALPVVTANITLAGSQSFDDATIGTAGSTLAVGTYTLTENDGDTIESNITGSGTLDLTGGGMLTGDNSGYSGAINVGPYSLFTKGDSPFGTGLVTFANGSDVNIAACSNNQTITGNLAIQGASSSPVNPYTFTSGSSTYYSQGTANITTGIIDCTGQDNGGGSSGPTYDVYYQGGVVPSDGNNVTLAGAIDLGASATIQSEVQTTTITSSLSGNYALSVFAGGSGQIVINSASNTSSTANGTYSSSPFTADLTGSNSAQTTQISGDYVVTIDGVYGAVNVTVGGTLKGIGTVGNLLANDSGIIAPGHSPGCLTVSGNLNEGAIYQAEIGGTTACTDYDELDVTGTVTLNDGASPATAGTLQLSLINGFKPTPGQTFEIINNEGSSLVSGTFASLPQGSEITVSGYTFKISYTGGTGNDVVLTAVKTPGTPDTGFGLFNSSSSSVITIGITTLSALALVTIARRYNYLTSKK